MWLASGRQWLNMRPVGVNNGHNFLSLLGHIEVLLLILRAFVSHETERDCLALTFRIYSQGKISILEVL